MQQAEAGITELAKSVDSLVVIPNERLKLVSEQTTYEIERVEE